MRKTKKKALIITGSLIVMLALGAVGYFVVFRGVGNSNSTDANTSQNAEQETDSKNEETISTEDYNKEVIAGLEKSKQAALDAGDQARANEIQASIDTLMAEAASSQETSSSGSKGE